MESTHSKRDIFVVADDLGLAKSINDGIVFLLKEGKIDGASLMANGNAFEDAVNQIQDIPDPQIGIHLVLVEEKSLSGIKLPKNHKTFFIKYVLGLTKKGEIEKELESQIQKVLETGIKPQFINSHQHLHLLPGIMNVVIFLAKKYGIPYIRIVNEPSRLGANFFRKAQLCFLRFLSKIAKKRIVKGGLKCNDFFVGFINAGNMGIDDVEYADDLSKKYPDKIIELGCHPGYENEELRHQYKKWGNYSWEKELNLLKDTTLIGVVKAS